MSGPLRAAARRGAIALIFSGPRLLGRGVALTVGAPDLLAVRNNLAHEFAETLTPQDRQGFRPHVTIQNKVSSDTARGLYESLNADFQPFVGVCQGLLLWRYRGGPWELEAEFPFDG